MQLLRWNNPGQDTRRASMVRGAGCREINPRLRRREKNVLDIPFYRSGVCCPTWSPDNRQIAFMRFLEKGFSINVISALGGAEKTLYTSGSGLRGMCAHLDWSPDGKLLAFSEPREDRSYNPRITLISLDD